jgi:putative aldouronate transport system substrate-binding protein
MYMNGGIIVKRKPLLAKLVFFLVLASLIISLGACNTATTTSTQGTTKGTTTGTTSQATTVPVDPSDRFGRYAETVTVSVLSTDLKSTAIQYDSSNPDRKSATENIWIDAYLEHLNIKVDRRIAEDATALNAIINTGMASGDLADIMIVSKEMFYTLMENGVCADIGPAYEAYVSSHGTMLRDAIATYPDGLNSVTFNGQVLAVPQYGNVHGNSEVLWIRQDWLDAVGKTAPTTINELIAVAEAFQAAKFNGKDIIGLGLTNVPSSIMAAYGVVMDTWHQKPDNSYVFSNVRDEMKSGLLAVQDLYKRGLVKSDFAVTNVLGEEVANGLVGMYYGPAWHAVTHVQANMNNEPDAVWTAVKIPSLDGSDIKQWTNDTLSTFFVVNKDAKNPEAIFKMLELEMKLFYEPTAEEKLKYYYTEDDYQIWNFRVFRNFIYALQDHMRAEAIIDSLNRKDESIALFAEASYDRVKKGLAGDRSVYGFYLGFVIGHPIIIEKREKNLLYGGYNGPLTENMTLYQSTINEALTNAMLKVITGDSISVFENAVATWYSSGGQAITDDVNAYYRSMN